MIYSKKLNIVIVNYCLCEWFKSQFHAVDCPHPTCSDHGWCVTGTCVCQRGWRGGDCSVMDADALQVSNKP